MQGQRFLTYWVTFLKDAVYMQEGVKDQIVNLDQVEIIKILAEFSREFLLDLMQKSLRAEQAFGANRDPQLVVEELYITSRPTP